MNSPDIVIFGTTHIAMRLAAHLAKRFAAVLVIGPDEQPSEPPQGWQYMKTDLTIPEFARDAKAVYVVTEEDNLNIRLALAMRSLSRTVPIIISLIQSRLGKKLQRHLENFSFVSPPELAAQQFVAAIEAPARDSGQQPAAIMGVTEPEIVAPRRLDPLLLYAITATSSMALTATIYFHYWENLSWLDAVYFVVTLMATVGFGDISLREATSLSKIIGIILMIASVTNTAVLFALITDSLLRHRLALSFGRRKIKYADHVLVIGIGAVGLRVVVELLRRGETVVVIDEKATGRFMPAIYSKRLPVIIGDACLEKTLRDAGLVRAKAMLSMTSDDLTNLEIGLNAKSLAPGVRVILRVYDQGLAKVLDERLDIHFALSMSMIAARALAELADGVRQQTAAPQP